MIVQCMLEEEMLGGRGKEEEQKGQEEGEEGEEEEEGKEEERKWC